MKISVCMATYNGEKYISEQIDSILSQIHPGDELIISDDGSKDKTLEIVNSFKDPRIKVLKFNGRNIIRNFENALSQAQGDIIFLSDQDDIWLPNKVSVSLDYLEKYDLVFSNLIVFNDDAAQGVLLYKTGKRRTGIFRNVIKNNYIGATMGFHRKILDKALPFPQNVYMHDIWLALVAEILGRTCFIKEPLIYYRRHEENASETGQKSSNTLLKKLKMRFHLVRHLVNRFI